MDTQTFAAAAKADGYSDQYERELVKAQSPDPHAHDFDARLMVLDGSITLTIDGQPTTYTAGHTCEVPRGTVHAEEVGPKGVKLFVAKRTG